MAGRKRPISRSTFYDQPVGESPLNLGLMRLIDEQFLETPWCGSRQMASRLRRRGDGVGRMRVRRLMAKMALAPICQKPRTTIPHPQYRAYKHLQRGLTITQYASRSPIFLVAVMEWATRKVLAWRLSKSMDVEFCAAAVEEALAGMAPGRSSNGCL